MCGGVREVDGDKIEISLNFSDHCTHVEHLTLVLQTGKLTSCYLINLSLEKIESVRIKNGTELGIGIACYFHVKGQLPSFTIYFGKCTALPGTTKLKSSHVIEVSTYPYTCIVIIILVSCPSHSKPIECALFYTLKKRS